MKYSFKGIITLVLAVAGLVCICWGSTCLGVMLICVAVAINMPHNGGGSSKPGSLTRRYYKANS